MRPCYDLLKGARESLSSDLQRSSDCGEVGCVSLAERSALDDWLRTRVHPLILKAHVQPHLRARLQCQNDSLTRTRRIRNGMLAGGEWAGGRAGPPSRIVDPEARQIRACIAHLLASGDLHRKTSLGAGASRRPRRSRRNQQCGTRAVSNLALCSHHV